MKAMEVARTLPTVHVAKRSKPSGPSLRRKAYNRIMRTLLWVCAGITCALLIFIMGYIFYRGVPRITWELLTTQESVLKGTVGILPAIYNTLYVVAITLIIALPLGVGAAVYLTEYAKNYRMVAIIEFATETLSGIPSIIYALVGLLVFSGALGLKKTLFAASLTLMIMILPTIIRTTQESLKTVPQGYREGALGLGAGKWHMIRTIVIPGSIDGIVTGCILAIGRIVGESAVLIYVAGMGVTMNHFFKSGEDFFFSSGATITSALYVYAKERADFDLALGIAAILVVLTLIINLCATQVGKKLKRS